MRNVAIFLLLAAAGIAPALSQASYYEVVEVPRFLGGSLFFPEEIIRNDSGLYTAPLSLGAGPILNAVEIEDAGTWLLSVAIPTLVGGTLFEGRDVFRRNADGTFSSVFTGALNGVPPWAGVDAVYEDPPGDLVLSFDVPVFLGGMWVEQSDLVAWSGATYTLVFDASAAGIPPTANLTGADRMGPDLIFSLNVPVVTGFGTFLGGELISWDGGALSSFDVQPGWPADRSGRVNGLAMVLNNTPGEVPPTISVSLSSPTTVRISWAVSACGGAADYGIYEGVLGSWGSHTAVDCSDDLGDLQEEIPLSPGSVYYLVVPNNPTEEGSYGVTSSGAPRPRGVSVCRAAQFLGCP